MKEKSIIELKKEYGTIVLHTAIINLLDEGKETVNNSPIKETLQTINNFFTDITQKKLFFPVTEEFVKEVLNCEYELCKLKQIEILTYFKKEQFDELQDFETEKEEL